MARLFRHKSLSDLEIVTGLQMGDAEVEKAFFDRCYAYFRQHYSSVMANAESRAATENDVFQETFVKIWMEITSRKIFIRDNQLWRTDTQGRPRRFTASLLTYLMAVAKYCNYEMERQEAIYVDQAASRDQEPSDELPDLTAEQIVEQCVNSMPPRCREILTLFYFEGKSLDEIMALRKENHTYNGTKTAKAKCLAQLKSRILYQFKKHKINTRPYA